MLARLAALAAPAALAACLIVAGLITAGLIAAGSASPGLAQDLLKQAFGGASGSKNTNQPLLLQADEMIYDRHNDLIIAKGNVEIYHNDHALLADEVVYDQKANTLTAAGNVRIKQPDGSVVSADRITLTSDFREGFLRSLHIVTKEEGRIAAASAYRKDGETTVFERGVFTPCKACEKNPEAPPIWRIKAQRVIHKKAEQNIYYEDAQLEIFGYPVLWTPYFYHADPEVKRRSGFLAPEFGKSGDLGFVSQTPYYYALSPHYDLTVTPVITTEAGFLLKGEWRHRLETGSYKVNIAGVYNDDPPDGVNGRPAGDEFRGSIQSKGEFKLASYWKWGWDGTLESDNTFRRFYKLDGVYATDRVSQLYLKGQSDRNYFETSFYHLGGLTFKETDEADSVVHPVIDYNYIFADPVLGGELSFDANALSLTREDGADTHRAVAQVRWRRTLTDPIGQVFTPFFHARGDLYKVTSFTDPITADQQDAESFTRQMVTGGIEYRYPFVKHTSFAAHVVEPIAQLIVRPNVSNQKDVPNEDAQSLVFDDTLLFDIDKFSGYDRLETGTRANAGVQYTMQTNWGWNARVVAGQSYHLGGDNPYTDDSGLGTGRSDYVTGFYLDSPRHLRFVAQARFDEDDLELKRQDLRAIASYGPVLAALSYVSARPQPGLGFYKDREEIHSYAAVKVADHWTVFGDIRYDIDMDQMIKDSIGVKYSDECFMMSVTYTQTFIRDDDIRPDQSVMFKFEFKGLGDSDKTTDAIGGFSPEAEPRAVR